ncbi:MAG: DegT/DnrJ/EryC1/StrS aminotransferase family protein [Treponema sp.]
MSTVPTKALRDIPFFKPSFDSQEEEAVLRVLHSGWLTTGKETLAFEKEFAAMVHSPHALAVNSASNGLMLAMEALGIGCGTKILTSPYTFVSTATSALHLGGEVVYADIEPDSYNIDPEKIEECLKKDPAIKAIVPIHIAGNLCDMKAIRTLAERYKVAVIEDAAHSFPSKTAAGYGGTFGDAGVFSFYATKTITTGEGGMVCVRNEETAERIKLMRSHGINRTIWDRYTDKHASWQYDVVAEGFKCNLPDILSAIGRVQLQKAENFYRKRKNIAERFNGAFKDYNYFELPPDGEGNAWHLYLLRIVPETLSIGRDDFARALQEQGLGISVHFIPHFEFTFLKNRYGLNAQDFPNAADHYAHTVSLPFWPDMSGDDVEYVIDTVIRTAEQFRR